jgi:hypothetical protein
MKAASHRAPSAWYSEIATVLAGEEKLFSFIGTMRAGWLKAIVAGALLWVAIYLIATAFQPAHAGSSIATIELGLSFVLAIFACLLLRW